MAGFLRFGVFFVGVSLVLASLVLAYPAGPAYEQSYTHVETLDELPPDASDVTFYSHLTERQEDYVDRALDGQTVRIPAYRDLPPEYVYHQNQSAIYRFEKARYYDTGRTAGKAGVGAFIVGVASVLAAFRMDNR